ncbi:LysR family transcriptional regulator [Brucella anthropi]|uniref:LysR family transcriptional regulator n=1 Tax=Brucella anthropi TaxID=529 RepID=UPI0035B566C3
MDILHFKAFRATMLNGSISKASKEMGRSQPGLSRMLDRLKHELGVSLFDRRKGL